MELQQDLPEKLLDHQRMVYHEDEDRLDVGKDTIKVLHTPRHSLGSIYLLLNENFLFTGDLFGIAEGDLHGWLSFDTPA
jgi:glyoxylase-like metal-dependent hydrolase (beta-lactamase superfamily II)